MPRLLFYRDPDTAWRQVLLPWFRFWPREAWKQERPVIFLAPDSSTIAWVKHRLVHAGVPALGLEFLTPGGLRSLLRTHLDAKPLALREDLRLLMELAAGDLPDNPVAQATAQEPSDFLRHCDRLESAGWGSDAFHLPEARELAKRFYELLAESGLQTSASGDRALVAGVREPVIAQVMAYGFGSGEGGSLTLLRALPQLAESAAYCLPVSGDKEDELVWRSTLEQLGDADEIPADAPRPLADLANAAEFHQRIADDASPLKVALAPDISLEACAIENEIHRWRAQLAPGERIGVVFARDGLPLAREVARRLTDARLAHQDEIGHLPGRRAAQQLVEAWRVFQDEADADSARNFARALRRAGQLSAEAERALWQALEYAFNEAMTTDIAVLRPLLAKQRHGAEAEAALANWPLLPAEATFAEYTQLCLPVLQKLRWPERLDAWEQRAKTLVENLDRRLRRTQYLRWLAEVIRIPGRTRPALGREAFAPIVLTTVERAAAQTWQYLVFAGLNRGDWPAEQSDSLLLDAQLSSRLNYRACMDSPVGEGQQCLRPGKSWLANSLDDRRRFKDACTSLLRNVQADAFFTAHRENPADPGREQDLADWLHGLFHAAVGAMPGEHDLRVASQALAAQFAAPPVEEAAFPAIADAWQRRRDPATPFDEFSFGFAEAPASPLALASRGWETALNRPANAWLQNVLHVRPLRELAEQDPRAKTTGIWAHTWAQPTGSGRAFIERLEAEDWALDVDRQAQVVRRTLTAAFAEAGRSLPDWWRIDWAIARNKAHQFVRSLLEIDWRSIRTERDLPGEPLKLPGHPLDGLTLTGRIDALISDAEADILNDFPADAWPTLAVAWIIDFKTGGDSQLDARKLEKGAGIQLALYALTLHAMGSEHVRTSLLKPGDAVEAKVSLETIFSLETPWATIGQMARSGVLGLRGPQRDEYSFVGDYPLAHLDVDPGVLESKWEKTFGAAE
ncbi:PD-(D/E)XK nuclease family protein [Cerasicoccus maritimus]|uniref:PD-(D/E)XK nuclease family protein n=1 Tax=Cerasicoccus maritimus TaxID=490089 RepID=UPI002852A73F|nr:PD-(D/E)XK nuclease family protein [Cerasicoccus maritimus]